MIANKSNKAIVLIATIATLAVISVILMFFAQSSMFERQLTSNNNLEQQAKLVATASIEWAASYIPKLAMGADEGDSEVKSKAYSSVADFYQFKVLKKEDDDSKKKYDPHCPVEEHYSADTQFNYKYRGTPSFHYENKEYGLPYEYSYRQNFDTNMVALPTVHNPSNKLKEDNLISRSNVTPRWTVHSTLKCIDANAFWNINSPIVGERSKKNYNTMVKTLLSVIFKNEDNDTTIDVDDIDIDEVTNAWVEVREDKEKEGGEEEEEQKEKKSKFENLGEFRIKISSKLKEKKKKGLTQQQLDKLCRYITVDSWGNKKSFRYGEKYTNYNKDYDKEDNHSTDSIKETRYPININVASKEILTVVFNQITTKSDISIGYSEAKNLADKIVRERTPDNENDRNTLCFKTWNDVEKYLYDYFGNNKKDQAEAIFAVIYPGMLPNDKSPNRAQYRKFDKGDIEVGTTECCLFSPGVFYCEAIGRVIEYNKKPYTVLAHSKVSVNMKLWEPYIVNSQSDFESQRDKNLDPEKVAAWSSIEGGYTPYDDTYKHKVAVGYLHERQEEEPSSSKDSQYKCRYWQWADQKDSVGEKRSDGLFMLNNPQNFGVVDELEKKEEWKDDGFDLWIKPSYEDKDNQDDPVFKEDKDNSLLLVVKKEKADTSKDCYILTRLAYDRDDDYDDKMVKSKESYLTLSRTLIINDDDMDKKKSRTTDNIRVFYNAYIRKDDQNDTLTKAGRSVYSIFRQQVRRILKSSGSKEEISSKHLNEYMADFAAKFKNQVYEAIMEGKKQGEIVDVEYKLTTEIDDDWKKTTRKEYKDYKGYIRIFLPLPGNSPERDRWNHAKIIGGFTTNTDFELTAGEGTEIKKVYIFNRIFANTENTGDTASSDDPLQCNREDGSTHNWIDLNPNPKHDKVLHYGYITRKNPQKEAREIDWFPGKGTADGPIQSIYRYSRTESRIPIKLYRGRWYHIHVRWEKNRLLITEFEVSFKKMKDTDAQELNDISSSDNDTAIIKTEPGKLRKNLLSGPGRVWVLNKSGSEFSQYPTEYKTYCYCPNCVIYYSKYNKITDNNKKYWRYWPDEKKSIYNGNFKLENMYAEHNDPNYFYYGTVAWTQFAPENKDHGNTNDKEPNGTMFWVKINGNEKQFYSWGEEANYSGDLDHPNFIFMKKYDDSNKMSFKFDLHDNDAEGEYASHLETTIVDRVVLYMIVQPQPLHWSHNIYKDQK